MPVAAMRCAHWSAGGRVHNTLLIVVGLLRGQSVTRDEWLKRSETVEGAQTQPRVDASERVSGVPGPLPRGTGSRPTTVMELAPALAVLPAANAFSPKAERWAIAHALSPLGTLPMIFEVTFESPGSLGLNLRSLTIAPNAGAFDSLGRPHGASEGPRKAARLRRTGCLVVLGVQPRLARLVRQGDVMLTVNGTHLFGTDFDFDAVTQHITKAAMPRTVRFLRSSSTTAAEMAAAAATNVEPLAKFALSATPAPQGALNEPTHPAILTWVNEAVTTPPIRRALANATQPVLPPASAPFSAPAAPRMISPPAPPGPSHMPTPIHARPVSAAKPQNVTRTDGQLPSLPFAPPPHFQAGAPNHATIAAMVASASARIPQQLKAAPPPQPGPR